MADTLPATWGLWDHLAARLRTDRIARLLGGTARVHVTGERMEDGPEDKAWGRLVIVPTSALWSVAHAPGKPRRVGFLVRVDIHKPERLDSYNPGRTSDAVHAEVYELLQGHVPPIPDMAGAMVALPIYLWTPPQPVPLWDEARRLYYTSAEYRTEVAPKPPQTP